MNQKVSFDLKNNAFLQKSWIQTENSNLNGNLSDTATSQNLIMHEAWNLNHHQGCSQMTQFRNQMNLQFWAHCPLGSYVFWRSDKTESRLTRHIYIDSPKKWTNKGMCLFAFLLFTANKTNSLVRFLGESTARPNCFWFYLTFTKDILMPP